MELKGLTEAEVVASRRKYGENRITEKKRRGFFPRLLDNLGDPMIKILLIALAINLLFLFNREDWVETAGIAAAVLLAVLISTLSEQGSESAFRKLQEEASRVRCKVMRENGRRAAPPTETGEGTESGVTVVTVEEVVVGDLILLQAGDRVPADGRLVRGTVELDQSAVNGETKEARKIVGDVCLSGTVAVAGQGVLLVTTVGDRTVYGQIATEVQEEKGASPLKTRLGGLAKTISRFGYMGAALAALAYLFHVLLLDSGFEAARVLALLRDPAFLLEKLLHAATLAVTVIVVAVPEGLPMMITVVLSSNMKRMLRDNVLVRKLVGIETAGSLNILFTDKTGTLTKGRLQVTDFIDASGRVWGRGGPDTLSELSKQPLWPGLHRAIVYNCSAVMSGDFPRESGQGSFRLRKPGPDGTPVGGNATDRALLEYAAAYPVTHRLRRGKIIPFDSKNKFMSTEVTGEINGILIKGAPEVILPRCVFYGKNALEESMGRLQDEGARLIAVAENNRLLGIFAVRDDVRAEAAGGVRQIQNAGIQVVMLTGDAKATARAIARKTHLLDGDNGLILTSGELARMSDEELGEALPRLRVVARALPGDKSRLVRVAQQMGLVTGMTGDGVNDAPALKRADVGFAMGSGTEVAKEAGDIVILDDNLLSIAKAIRYGRTIFKSIRKFIVFQLTLNFCALGVSVIAPLIGVESPITVIQMLWINMVMDTLAGLAFGGEPALLEYMREKPKRRDEPIINGYMRREIALGGLYAVAVCLWFLKSPVTAELFSGQAQFMTAFFALFMFMGIFQSLCARTHHVNLADHLAANKPFIGIMGLVAAAQTALIYTGGAVFRTAGLAPGQLIFVLLLASTAVFAHLLRIILYEQRGMAAGM
ncbi:MAG: cation-translocating P-type ATPase [Oscillospiraceae bacterium]|nr:cation-translocating P-type ATPase [Oscillospiraceae bacterium]